MNTPDEVERRIPKMTATTLGEPSEPIAFPSRIDAPDRDDRIENFVGGFEPRASPWRE